MDRHARIPELSRRTFLTTTGTALVSAALGSGRVLRGEAAQRHPQRGSPIPSLVVDTTQL